ncbi:hypothetical protein [Pseudoalteromonas sp. 3-MNA-CIBAN-0064]|uniref:hypothetical protein n=2 Tax=Pseudoalteromonas TaxID=53246 RepID=UPI0033323CCC
MAIGIPLSIQFSAQYSDKHDNALLSTRLTRGKWVNPKSILVLSFIYIALSLYYLGFASNEHSFLYINNTHLLCIKLLLPILFIALMWFTFYFYWRLFNNITIKSSNQIQNYLQIDRKPSTRWLAKVLEPLLKKRSYLAEIDSINAGLELLIYNIEQRSWDLDFKEVLYQFHATIRLRFDSSRQTKTIKLSTNDLAVIKNYWNTLLRLVRHARKNEDISMSFHTQRLIADVMSWIVYHPERQLITSDSLRDETTSKICWTLDLYELARWQGYQTTNGIDLILECEWFHNLFYASDKLDLKNSTKGLLEFHKLATDIFDIISKSHPHKVISFIKNISQAVSYGQKQQHYYVHTPDEETQWLKSFWLSFNKIIFCIDNIDEIADKINSLSNGEAFKKYKNGSTSKPLNELQLQNVLSAIKLDEIFECIHFKLVKRMGWDVTARLAYYERWTEFYACLYWKQPKEADANYCGETLLAHSSNELANLIFADYLQIEHYWRFKERHAIKTYAYRAFLFQLCFFTEQGEEPKLIYTSGHFGELATQLDILESLLKQERYIRSLRSWNPHVTSVCNNLRDSIQNLEKRKLKLITHSKINEKKWQVLQESIENGWGNIFSLAGVIDVSYSHKIGKSRATRSKFPVERARLITGNSFSAYSPYMSRKTHSGFIDSFYEACLSFVTEQKQQKISLPKENPALYFSPQKNLQQLGFRRSGSIYWKNEKHKNILAISVDSHLLVDCSKVKLKITKNLCSEGSSPLFISLNDSNEPMVEIQTEMYFDLEILEEGAFTFEDPLH